MMTASRPLHVKAVRAEMREADFVASTDAIDSYDEIVAQNWDLERYKANPVVLYAHDSSELPIGKSVRIEMVNGSLECTIQFASAKANPRAEEVWMLVQEKVLRAVSVGFNPREVRSEKREDRDVYVLDDNELYEISVVPVPANPEALSKMKRRALERATETPNMNVKELQDRAEAAEKLVKELEMRATAAEAECASRKSENEALAGELATERAARAADAEKIAAADKLVADAQKAAADAADALLVKEVDALVGVKFTPAERDEQLELARSNKAMFDKLAAKRPDLKILGASVISAEKEPNTNSVAEPATGDGLAAEAKQLAAKKADGTADQTVTPWG